MVTWFSASANHMHSAFIVSTGDSICILALGSGERLLYPSNRVRTVNPVLVSVRDMVSASLSSAVVESPVVIESPAFYRDPHHNG